MMMRGPNPRRRGVGAVAVGPDGTVLSATCDPVFVNGQWQGCNGMPIEPSPPVRGDQYLGGHVSADGGPINADATGGAGGGTSPTAVQGPGKMLWILGGAAVLFILLTKK